MAWAAETSPTTARGELAAMHVMSRVGITTSYQQEDSGTVFKLAELMDIYRCRYILHVSVMEY